LNISLPLHCYMPEPSQFDRWIKQQAFWSHYEITARVPVFQQLCSW
jgi:hypothetical protein